MEFRFAVSDIFKEPIVEINSNMLPPGFAGDRRAMWDALTRTTEVVNAMGEASAKAQGLSKPITTAERLRNSEQQRLYLLVDRDAKNGKGVVTGMLKTGNKGLYIFDREGQHYQVTPPCVLDFYVHESRQRSGLGKQLFEHMLQREKIEPVKIAIDRPSDKFLGFLNKHYRLNNPIKQMNNFVVFDGFFPDSPNKEKEAESGTPVKAAGTSAKAVANGLQSYPSPLGRYGAPRPPCSMGQIIHNQSPTVPQAQESASCPGRLNQTQSGYPSTIPRQAYSTYQTNVSSSSVPNEMQYAQQQQQPQQMQMGGNGGFVAPSYQQSGNTQQQQVYNTQTQNAQQQYYQPSGYDAAQSNVQQMQMQQQPIVQEQQQLPSQTYQQQQLLNSPQGQYIQPQNQFSYDNKQQYMPQQFTQPQYVQQSPSQVSYQQTPQYMPQQQLLPPQTPYQQPFVQPQTTVSAPQMQFAYEQQVPPQTVQSQQIPQQQLQQMPQQQLQQVPQQQLQQVPQQQLQQMPPQQLPQQQLQQVPQQQLQKVPQQQLQQVPQQQLQQVPQQQLQQMQQPYYQPNQNAMQPQQLATNSASAPNVLLPATAQSLPYLANNQTANHPLPSQSEKVLNTQAYVAYGQNAQGQVQNNLQQTNQPVQVQNTHSAPQNVVPQTQQPISTQEVQQQPNQTPQIGDTLQPQVVGEQKYHYYDSSKNEMRSSPVQNVAADGVAKKPSASGDRNAVSDKESTYELEYPPRTPPTEPEKKSQEEQAHSSPKLERPRSLSIQMSVEESEKKEEAAAPPQDSTNGELQEETDDKKSEEDQDEKEVVETKMEKLDVKEADKSPDVTDGAYVGRKTPHLTDQGFFDLKFYHNKLW